MMRYALALLVLFAVQFVPGVGTGEAKAANCAALGDGCNIETAYYMAKSVADAYKANSCPSCTYTIPQYGYPNTPTTADGYFEVDMRTSGGSYIAIGGRQRWFSSSCAVGTTWTPSMGQCFDPSVCATRAPLGATKASASGSWSTVCSEGCEYEQAAALSIQWEEAGTGNIVGFTTGWKPSGDACPAGTPAPVSFTEQQECRPAPDGQTFCIKPNGDHCYSLTNGSGRQICWKPGQTGEKTDGSQLQVRNGGSTPTTPTTTPPPGETFTQQGDPVTATSTVNGTAVTTTTTNYVTGNGTDAGDSSQGEAGDGSGEGSGEGGGAGEGVGDLYEGTGKTVESVWAAYKARVEGAPIIAATGAFLSYSTTGSCPAWTVPATEYWPEMTATWLCNGPLADNLVFAGWIALALAAWAAFKIGVLW